MEDVTEFDCWKDYFEQEVVKSSSLDAAVIEEIREKVAEEGCDMFLDCILEPLGEAEKVQRMRGVIDRIMVDYQQCDTEAKNLILAVSQLTDPHSATKHVPAENTSSAPKVVAEVASVSSVITPSTKPHAATAEFPVEDTSSLWTFENPLQRLEELMEELKKHGSYQRIREEYCHLSIVINRQGLLAPAFRPPVVTGKKYGDPVFKEIHRDHIVIDCDWLHATKQPVNVRNCDVEFKPMFMTSKPFPFDVAFQFASKEWKNNHRVVEMLRLTRLQQCQLIALRSDQVKKDIDQIEDGTRKDGKYFPSPLSIFEQGLSAWCERDRRILKHRDGYAAVWKARSYLGPAEPVALVGKLAAMILGEPPKDHKTIRSKEENIVRHITGR